MNQSSIERQPEGAPDGRRRVYPPRRTFLKSLAAAVGGLVLARAGGGVTVAAGQGTPTPLATVDIPVPSYVPHGYRLGGRFADLVDGFSGGSSEMALWYVNPSASLYLSRPLVVYIAPEPRFSSLACTRQRLGIPTSLSLQSGRQVSATYHDGLWSLPPEQRYDEPPRPLIWDTRDVHSLTFVLDDLTIGIRASRVAGVTREALVSVANSLI